MEKGRVGMTQNGDEKREIHQFGLEYWLSLELARTCSSGTGSAAGAAREREVKATMAEMRVLVNCILNVLLVREGLWL
jgi:hypothetical protein